jgi:hypothetical protein
MVDEWGDLRVRADTRSDGRVRPLTDSAVLKAPMWSEMLSAKQPILFAPDDGSDTASWRQELLSAIGKAGKERRRFCRCHLATET